MHDRNTASLSSALDRLKLAGAIFLRGRYTEAWTYESVPADDAREEADDALGTRGAA